MEQIKIDVVKQWLINKKEFSPLDVIEALEKENKELKEKINAWENGNPIGELLADKEYLDNINNEQTKVILELQEQIERISVTNFDVTKKLKAKIEKMKCFIHSEIDFCTYCPLTNECKNEEGTCPYAYATEEEQKNLLMDYIQKWEAAE